MIDIPNTILQIPKEIFQEFLSQLKFDFVDLIELCIIFLFMLFVYKKYIKGTHSEKFVRSLLVLVILWAFSEILTGINLNILGYFLKTGVAIIVLSLVVVFQPELRKLLSYLGQNGIFSKDFFTVKEDSAGERTLNQIMDAVKYCSRVHRGMLLVFGKNEDDVSISDVGTILDAEISAPLLLTIFHPNTPLHDGATMIAKNRIISAGVLLPLTEDPKLSWKYGTRHRAAIGMSESSNCVCLVVSEENGDISLAFDGTLKKYDDLSKLREDLSKLTDYAIEETSDLTESVKNVTKFKFFLGNGNKKDNVQ